MAPKNTPKKVKCKWFNKDGHPRINPEKIRRGQKDPVGCTYTTSVCHFAHPDHPDWKTARDVPRPRPSEYPDGRVPRTPLPSWWTRTDQRRTSSRSRSRSTDRNRSTSPASLRRRFNVKEEPRSPPLQYGSGSGSREISREGEIDPSRLSSSLSLAQRIGGRRSASPISRQRRRDEGPGPYSRGRGHSPGPSRERRAGSHSRECERERGVLDNNVFDHDRRVGSDRPSRYSRDRDRDTDRLSVNDSSREFSSSFKSFSLPKLPLTAHHREQPHDTDSAPASASAGVTDSSFDRGTGRDAQLSTPIAPRALRDLALMTGFGNTSNNTTSRDAESSSFEVDPSQQPPTPAPPLTDPAPLSPGSPPSFESIALNTFSLPSERQNIDALPVDQAVVDPPPLSATIAPVSATSSTTMAPPPESTSTAGATVVATPKSFQYSVPPKPGFLDAPSTELTEGSEKKEELTQEERAEIWDKRIELLGEAIAAKRALNDRLADLKQRQTFTSADRIANVTENAREQIMVSLQDAQARVSSALERVKVSHQKVLELDFWPARRLPGSYLGKKEQGHIKREEIEREEEQESDKKVVEDEHVEIKQKVGELGDAMIGVDKQMKEVALLLSSRTRACANGGVSATTSAPVDVSVDWEPSDGQERGWKRRKTGDDGAYMHAGDSGTTSHVPISPTASKTTKAIPRDDMRLLTNRLLKLENSFADLENLHVQDDDAQREELNTLVETHMERVSGELVDNVRSKYEEKVKKLEEEMAQMGNEVQELAGEVAELIEVGASVKSVQSRLEEERAAVEAERQELRAAMEESTSKSASLQTQLAASIEETQALRQRLKVAIESSQAQSKTSEPPSAPTPTSSHSTPHTQSLQELTTVLTPRILSAVRSDLSQRLLAQQSEIIQVVRNQGPWQEVNAIREMVERVVALPEVLNVLQSSGVLSHSGAGGLGGGDSGVPVGSMNGNGTGTKIAEGVNVVNGIPPNAWPGMVINGRSFPPSSSQPST